MLYPGMVDRFLQHHATADAIRQLASTDPTLKVFLFVFLPVFLCAQDSKTQLGCYPHTQGAIPRDEAHPAASLALHLGMCSMAAGNLSAALARCSAAAKQLKETIDSTHGMSMAMMRMQMGTALGCMGDCQKRMGDVQHAVQCYQDSITCLEHAIAAPPPEDGDEHHDDDGTPDQLHSTLVIELQQALSVSWSKLGDVWYLQDALPNATRCYHHVLQLRKQLINATPNPPPGMLLDVAVALTKLADVAQATGDMRQVGVFVKQAHDVAGSLAVVVEGEECKEEMQGGMGVKYAALMAALGSLAVGDGGGTSENGDEVGDEEGDEEG